MTENDKEIYLRVLDDLSFMQEIFSCCEFQADEFTASMLRERIHRERETVRLEKDRLLRLGTERQEQHQQEIERKSDD